MLALVARLLCSRGPVGLPLTLLVIFWANALRFLEVVLHGAVEFVCGAKAKALPSNRVFFPDAHAVGVVARLFVVCLC